jgi:type IV fimbrial biogenesis protein FimT
MARGGRIARIVSQAQASIPSLPANAPPFRRRSGLNMKASAGFTLIELLVVIVIVAIMMGIGVPSFKYVTNSSRLSAEINGLLGDMQLARAEAVKEGKSVTICAASADQTSCSNAPDWSNGWIVYADPTAVGVPDPNDILRTQKALHAGDTLVDQSGTLSKATFNRAGLLSLSGMPAAGITLTLHDSLANAAYTRCLVIVSQGLVTTQTPATDAACK